MGKKTKASNGKHAAQAPSEEVADFSTTTETTQFTPVVPGQEVAVEKKSHKKLAIVLGSIGAFLVAVYLAGVIFFSFFFMPNTTIGTLDISLMTIDQAGEILTETAKDYTLEVKGQGLSFSVDAHDTDLSIDANAVLNDAISGGNKRWIWPVALFSAHDESSYLKTSYSETAFSQIIQSQVDEFNAGAVGPTNATVAFSPELAKFAIVPEQIGTMLDIDAVMDKVNGAISSFEPTVRITEEELVQPMVVQDDPALAEARDSANTMIKADLKMMMNGNLVTEVGPAQTSQWIRLSPGVAIEFDTEALNAWATEIANACNTVGSERTYTRPDGKVITVKGGSYGWEIDTQAMIDMVVAGVLAGQVATLDIPVLQTGSGFTALGGQDWGARYCDIDLAEQHARFYDETGTLIWESAIITGTPDGKHNTPSGVYVLNSKASPSKLIGDIDPETKKPEYETVVKYWMPFIGNAIGLHDATWQPGFGGSMYRNGYGSHGCVNLPYNAAESLYGIIQKGDVVVTHW